MATPSPSSRQNAVEPGSDLQEGTTPSQTLPDRSWWDLTFKIPFLRKFSETTTSPNPYIRSATACLVSQHTVNGEPTTKPELSERLSLEQGNDLIDFLTSKAPQIRRVNLAVIAPNGYCDDATKNQQMTSVLRACLPIFRTCEVVLVTGYPLSDEAMQRESDVRNFHFEHSSKETHIRMVQALGVLMEGGKVRVVVGDRDPWILGHDGSVLIW